VSVRALVDARPDVDDLVCRAVQGDQDARRDLFESIHGMVVRYCRSRAAPASMTSISADDIAQEACIAVLTALPSYRQQGKPFIGFVYGIARHKLADAYRAAARSRSTPVAEVPDRPTDEMGPEQRALAGFAAVLAGELLTQLSEGQQEIIRLRVIVGLSVEETADALSMSPGAVRVGQHRALTKLRGLLASRKRLDGIKA